jgi:hypothetical protein
MIIELDLPLSDLMAKLGSPVSLIDDAIGAVLSCEYHAEGVKILSSDHTHSQMAPIKLGALQKLISGELANGSGAKDLVRIGLEKAVKIVLATIPKPEQVITIAPDAQVNKIIIDDHLKAVFSPKTGPAGVPKPPYGYGAIKVKLKEATKLYQPVYGTDEGSTYHCIAISDVLNVAVRIKTPSKVSIRVEGHQLGAYKQALINAGLSDSGSYCSVHLAADSEELARKCVGAVLFGMGVGFTQVATNLQPIWGQGT